LYILYYPKNSLIYFSLNGFRGGGAFFLKEIVKNCALGFGKRTPALGFKKSRGFFLLNFFCL
jgi:hypothetical protein